MEETGSCFGMIDLVLILEEWPNYMFLLPSQIQMQGQVAETGVCFGLIDLGPDS